MTTSHAVSPPLVAGSLARKSTRLVAIPALIAACTGVLYLRSLQSDNIRLTNDELFVALSAQSIATTGRDLNGRFLPLFFQMTEAFAPDYWFPPIPIYLVAAVLTAVPLSEAVVRLPMTLFAVVDVVLVYLVARRLVARESLAIAAAAILAMTPLHYYVGHLAVGYAAHLPFVLGWLLCVLNYLDGNRRRWLFGAGLMLGVGLYTYVAAVVLLPLYLLLTCVILLARREGLRGVLTLASGFMLAASPAVIFLLVRSTVVVDMFMHYQVHEGQFRGAQQPSQGGEVVRRLADYARLYAGFWSPHTWFAAAGWDRQFGGLFLFPTAGLFVAALIRLVTRPTLRLLIIAGGLACAPVPATLTPKSELVHRLMAMLPFAALISTIGLEHLFTAATPRARAFAFTAVWGSVIGLAVLYHDSLFTAQAVIRAAAVPVAVCGLAVLLGPAAIAQARLWHAAAVALMTIAALQFAYLVVPYELVVRASIVLLAVVAVAPLWPGAVERLGRPPLLAVASLAVLAGVFMHIYVDFTALPWLPSRHMTATLMPVRFVAAAAALAAVLWCVRSVTIERLSRGRALAAVAALAIAQLAYYYIDRFPDFPTRFVHATAVLLLLAALAQMCRSAVAGRLTLAQISAAAFFTIATTQFTFAYLLINVWLDWS